MKKLSLIAYSFLLFATGSMAQQTGVQFQKAANWQAVLDKAKKENKYIFVDCFATWCGPCKYMDKEVFPLPEVGEYFNARFVNVKVQMDQTKNDDEKVKQWYKDAKFLENNYGVSAFPTYLVFAPDGKPLHRLIGGAKTGSEFIARVKEAFVPEKQYYTNVADYKSHTKDSAWLRNAITVALKATDKTLAATIGNYYFDIVKDHYSKDNILVFKSVAAFSNHKAFKLFTDSPEKIDAAIAKGFASAHVTGIVYMEDVRPVLESDQPVDWVKLKKEIKKKYPIVLDKSLDDYELWYYTLKNKVAEYDKMILSHMEKYAGEMGNWELNQVAWIAFTFTSNKQVLEEALKWTERSIEQIEKVAKSNYPYYLDTYAQILYKLGRTQEALSLQKKAVELAVSGHPNDSKTAGLKQNLEKMEKGEKTWK